MDEVGIDLSHGEASVFIIFDTSQDETARHLAHMLSRQGILCWKTPDEIAPGTSHDSAIEPLLGKCDVVVVLFSRAADHSERVEREVSLADRLGLPMLLLRIEDIEPYRLLHKFRQCQWIDWSHGRDGVLVRVAEEVRRLAGAGALQHRVSVPMEAQQMNAASSSKGLIAGILVALLVLGGIAYGIWSRL